LVSYQYVICCFDFLHTFFAIKALHAFEHLQEPAPDSWAFLNQDYLQRNPEALTALNEAIIGESTEVRPKKRNGYQSRPAGGPLAPKADVKKSNVWVAAKKPSNTAGATVVNTVISNEGTDAAASSQQPTEKSVAR
jgi:hypothetical protein